MFGFSGFDSRVASQMLIVSKKLDFFCCWFYLENAINDGSEIRQAPVEVGS